MHDREKIRTHRWVKGWSQEELADRAGLSRATVSRIERGVHSNSRSVTKIAHVLGVSMEELIVNSR